MAHYAQLDENNLVINVIPATGDDLETVLEADAGGVWRRTSYNTHANQHALGGTPYRYNYAGIGYTFDPNYGEDGAFISPSPYPSWKLSNLDATWKAPLPYPTDGLIYDWDENAGAWVERG
jgi:hypothetical protein